MKTHSQEAKIQIIRYRYRLSRGERLFIAAACLAALIFIGYHCFAEVRHIQQTDESAFILRVNLLDEFINARRSFVDSMARLTQQNMEAPYDPTLAQRIVDHPEYGIYSIGDPLAAGKLVREHLGTLTGVGSKEELDRSILKEMQAVLKLDPLLKAQLSNDRELIWAYYTSAREFIYLTPAVPVSDYHFSTDEYRREFWYQAVPPANSYLRTIVTSLYLDAVGKGEMISISKPVLVDDQIAGVVSADIGIDTLREILLIGNSAGHTIILDSQRQLIASNEPSSEAHLAKVNLPAITGKPRFFLDGWWMKKSIADGRVYVLHHQELDKTIWQGIRANLHLPFIAFLLVAMTYLLLKLRRALRLVTDAMRTDPLTGLLNRRGFFEDVDQMMGLCKRQGLELSVMMLDINHFKAVNDRFGHAEGDKVLVDLAQLLRANLREMDSLCRWGGEEFAVFMPSTGCRVAFEIAERIRLRAEEELRRPDGAPITVSIGVTEASCSDTIDIAVEAADSRMYAAKKAGRNKVIYCDQL